MKKTLLLTALTFCIFAPRLAAAAITPPLAINDFDEVNDIVTLADANNNILAYGQAPTSNTPYEYLFYNYSSGVVSSCGATGTCGTFQWDLTEPGSGTTPGVWSDTLQLTYTNNSDVIGITFYSGDGVAKPIMLPATMLGTVEENHTFPLAFDPNGNTVQTIQVSSVPEPESYGMMLGGLGLLGFMVRRRKLV